MHRFESHQCFHFLFVIFYCTIFSYLSFNNVWITVLTFIQSVSWHKHIDNVKEKAWGRMNVMRRLKFCPDRKSLETIYLTFIRPILEYADVFWDNCTNYEKQELDKIQTEADRIVTGATKLVSLHALFEEVNWEPLEARRMKSNLLLFYKMIKNLSPE